MAARTTALTAKAGQTKGQGSTAFGAEWYVVGTNGKKIDSDNTDLPVSPY